MDAKFLLLLLPESSSDDTLLLSELGAGAAILRLLILAGTVAGDCCVTGWVQVKICDGCAAGVVWLCLGLEVD